MHNLKLYCAVLIVRSHNRSTAASIYGAHKSIDQAAKSFYKRGKEKYGDASVEVLWESICEVSEDAIREAGWVMPSGFER
jgi:hypothetical protein